MFTYSIEKKMKCGKCGSKTKNGIADYGYNNLCSFCAENLSSQKPVLCHYCNTKIWPNMSRFEGHETAVCQQCYKDKTKICFNCRYPLIKNTENPSAICEFCKPDLVAPDFSNQNMAPILAFISKYWSLPKVIPEVQWIPAQSLSELQANTTNNISFESIDSFIQFYYPVFYANNVIFSYPQIVNSWFVPYFGGQVVVAEIYSRFKIDKAKGMTLFDDLAIGLGAYFTYLIAKLLRNSIVLKYVKQFPKNSASSEFLKLKAMGEYRKHVEMKMYAEENLLKYAKKYYGKN